MTDKDWRVHFYLKYGGRGIFPDKKKESIKPFYIRTHYIQMVFGNAVKVLRMIDAYIHLNTL